VAATNRRESIQRRLEVINLPDWVTQFGNRVAVFVNPNSSGRPKLRDLSAIKNIFASANCEATFQETSTAACLQGAAHAALSDGKRVLFAIGGDGTFQALANAMYRENVLLGLLPTGGGNDFAMALKLRADPAAVNDLLVEGQVISVDLIQATTGKGIQQLYIGGGGLGLDAEAARLAGGTLRYLPGRFRYVAAALIAFISRPHSAVRIEFPDGEHEPVNSEALLVAILNTPTYGAGLKLALNADLIDGLVQCILVPEVTLTQLCRLIPRLLASGELDLVNIRRWNTKRVRLTTAVPTLFHGDGEILGPTPVEVSVVPRAVKVLVPGKI
jgi:diacylglycerol kinase (ATP)